MYYLEIALLVIGFVTLVIGYRRNSRNILVGAALALLASGALPDLMRGLEEGYRAGQVQSAG